MVDPRKVAEAEARATKALADPAHCEALRKKISRALKKRERSSEDDDARSPAAPSR